jgi:hypothetical protein
MPDGSPSGFQWAIPATRRSESDSSPACVRIASIFARSFAAAACTAPTPTPEKRDE